MQKPSVVDSPSGRVPTKLQDGISRIQKVTVVEIVFRFAPGCFRGTQVYIGGRSTQVDARGAPETGGAPYRGWRPPISWEPRLLLDLHSKSSGSRSFQNHAPEGFIPFGLRLIFLFFEILKQAKQQQYGLGLRLVGQSQNDIKV